MSHGPVIPVIVIKHVEDAVPMARALVAGGMRVLEVTLRTPVALAASRPSRATVPEAIVGAGTVRSAADAQAAHGAGARFAVSPGYIGERRQGLPRLRLPLLPGVATGSEIMAATDDGYRFLKFFPADAAGGIGDAEGVGRAVRRRRVLPDRRHHAGDRAGVPGAAQRQVVGGSWLTPADAMASGDWARIERLAREAAALRAR